MRRRRRTPPGGVEVEVEVPCDGGFRHPVTLAVIRWLTTLPRGSLLRQSRDIFKIIENPCEEILRDYVEDAYCHKYLINFESNFLSDDFVSLRCSILERLRGKREAIDILLTAMEEWKRPVWEAAIESLSAVGEEAINPTSARLRHSNPYVKWRAVRVLRRIGSQSAKRSLLRELNGEIDGNEALAPEKQDHIIWEILEALGDIDGAGVIPFLARYIHLENRYVACAAVNSLVRIIRNHLNRINQSETEENPPTLLAEVNQGVESLIGSLCIADSYVRSAIVNGLVQIGRPIVPKLIGSMMNPKRPWLVRVKCAQIIGKTGDPRALPALKRCLQSPNWGLRAESAIALAHIASTHNTSEPQRQIVRNLLAQRLAEETDERVLHALNNALGIIQSESGDDGGANA